MARDADFRARITVDDQASDEIEDLADAAEKLDGEKVEVKVGADTDQAERDIAGLLAKVDKLGGGDAGMILLDSNAAQITNDIGDLLVQINDLDAADPTIDIKVDQVKSLQGDLATLQAKAKEIGGTPISLNTGPARQGLDDIGKSASSSKSVLANMVGNATQDLGALGGVAGSAGVAIGQMGEYMVDASADGDKLGTVFKNFAAVAGPIAAIGIVVQSLTTFMANQKAEAEAAASRTEEFGKAMGDASDDALGLADALRENIDWLQKFNVESEGFGGGIVEGLADVGRAVPLLGSLVGDAGEKLTDLVPIMKAAGLSMYDLSAAIEDGGRVGADWSKQLDAARDSGKISEEQWTALWQAITKYGVEANKATQAADLLNVSQDEANAILQDTLQQSAPLEQFTALWNTLYADMADGTITSQGAADAINELADKLGLSREEVVKLAQGHLDDTLKDAQQAAEEATKAQTEFASAVGEAGLAMLDASANSDAFASALDRMNATTDLDFSQMAEDTVASFDDLKTAMEGAQAAGIDWSKADLTPDSVEELKGLPDEFAKITDGVSGMRGTIQAELQAAFDTGGIEAYTAKADFFRAQVLDQYPGAFRAAGASAADAERLTNDLIESLELLPEQKEIMIKLTREEQARNALDAFSSVIDKLPELRQIEIRTKIAEGDITGALALLNSELVQHGFPPIVLPVDADLAPAKAKTDTIAGITLPFSTVPFKGDPTEADSSIDGVKAKADSTTGTVQVQADAEQAFATMVALNLITAAFAPPPVKITADGSPAIATAVGTAEAIAGLKPIFAVDSQPVPAMRTSAAAADAIAGLKPVFAVQSNPLPALIMAAAAARSIAGLRPIFAVQSNPFPALLSAAAAVGRINGMVARVAVDAYLRSAPSASEIAARIGTVRVPVDAYIRTTPRVNGALG